MHETGSAVQPPELPIPDLPRLAAGQNLDLKSIRCRGQDGLRVFVYVPVVLFAIGALAALWIKTEAFFIGLAAILALLVLQYLGWKWTITWVQGNAIRVGANQYPQLHQLVDAASATLGIDPPTVFILHGHGAFDVLVMKLFSKRGQVIITSNLLDELTEHRSSREIMFYIGRQLGMIADGHFRNWHATHVLGSLSGLFYNSWCRRSQITADRIGLMVAGDLRAAEQALVVLTAGQAIAPLFDFGSLRQQRHDLYDSRWANIRVLFSTYPYLIDRIIQLRQFAHQAAAQGVGASAPIGLGALPIRHRRVHALPLMIVHGHDHAARQDLQRYLQETYPHLALIIMAAEEAAADSMPEKFERLASGARGAIALLTADDFVTSQAAGRAAGRARQNVVLEIGWFWARVGRRRCLLLMRGDVELPSDLAGVDIHRFEQSAVECAETLRSFLDNLETN